MPVQVSYPGVYVEEIPSGVRTITGVATSIAAFVGWAAKGPIDRAELVLSWADYERKFGGLDARSYLGYAVYHFFLNGGQQAFVVRMVRTMDDGQAKKASPASATLGTTMTVSAANPGGWGNSYGVKLAKRTDKPDRFRMEVLRKNPDDTETSVESVENMSVDPADQRFVEAIVNNESSLITVKLIGDKTQPEDVPATRQRYRELRKRDVSRELAWNTTKSAYRP